MATSDAETLRQQLNASFSDMLDDKLVEECITICQHYSLTGEDLLFKWEAMSFGVSPRIFNADTIPALKQHIQRELAKANAKKLHAKSNTSGLMSRNLNARVLPTASLQSPAKLHTKSDTSGSTSRNPNARALPTVSLQIPAKLKTSTPHRYMYEKISERSGALDDRIDDIAEVVQKHYEISELGDPSLETEEEVTVVGRVVLDADSSSIGPVKLNEASLTLESSRALGSGKRVPLKFAPNVRVRGARKGVQGAGFFPGAIVALRGRNGGGGWFLVTEILSLPTPTSRPLIPSTSDRAFSMCVASGPYTSDSDLKFDPWEAFLKKARSIKPSVVLLIGPFVDSSHPLIQDGEVDKSPAAIFQEVFLNKLSELLDDLPGSIALIVPSVRDILSDHAAFPQCELPFGHIQDSRITMLPNPCCFVLNDISFAATSVDVLFHLRKEEFFKRASEIASVGDDAQSSDMMANLCQHILQQKSFYPVFPVPLDAMHEVNLDISHSDSLHLCDEDNGAPNMLILPSKLKHFTKHINNVVVVNPSVLLKGNFAHIQFAEKQTELDVEIMKIDYN